MGKKYIVEIGRLERLYKASINELGKPDLTWLSPEIDLTPYTEPDLEQVRKEAYEKGYKKCMSENDFDSPCISCDKYEQGLNDAWEAARKIECDEGIDMNTLCTIFRRGSSVSIIRDYSASEAIEKIRQYEQEQEEIKIGDEVATDAGNRASVLYENPDGTQVFVFKPDGTAAWWTKSTLHRTGRNFPEIAAVLEKMRGEQE